MEREQVFKRMEATEEMDPYFIGFNIMTSSLKYDDMKKGIEHSLDLAKCYMLSDDIHIFQLGEDNQIHPFCSSHYSKITSDKLAPFIEDNKSKFIEKDYMDLLLNSTSIKRLTFLSFIKDNLKYLIVIVNDNIYDPQTNNHFMEILKKAFSTIFDRMEAYNTINRASKEDGLTKLGSRLAYNQKVDDLDSNKKRCVFTMIDLFRLKFINDNLGHLAGDHYIKKTAEILEKYFPKHVQKENGINERSGDTIYRIGGDEFTIISENKSPELVKELLELAKEEVESITFGLDIPTTTSLNYGICERIDNEPMEIVYQEADKALSDDKREMYIRLGINRRK